MNIIVADDEPRVRSALRLIFDNEPGLKLVAEAADGRELLRKAQCWSENDCSQGTSIPDLLLLDWKLPGWLPEKDMPALKAAIPGLRVIAMNVGIDSRTEALGLGADIYISKSDPPDALQSALAQIRDLCQQQITDCG
jgi:DNA-binding NarL/FixJ family response regulator